MHSGMLCKPPNPAADHAEGTTDGRQITAGDLDRLCIGMVQAEAVPDLAFVFTLQDGELSSR